MTAIQTVMHVQKEFPPADGWVVKYITVGGGIRLQHATHGVRMCWVNGHGKRVRIVVKDVPNV